MIALVPRSTLFPYTTLFRSEAAVLLEEGHRIGDGAHAAAVGALADEFHAVDKPLFPQRSGCGGVFEGQGSSFDRKETAENAPFVVADPRLTARHFDGGAVAEGKHAVRIRHVNGNGYFQQNFLKAALAL